ncbi:SH3 domain-containing protein [Mangrovivirga sp. M17]|uniref:SH3 domain-containing protein n=1 Tax=Mangrovivirga halotolerans TaxID=2993936 RepID=A0ABT3RPQ9_9BACT|nr:SH3 domain-containing protein [Mangrovivirga halotolerans]MCX2743466.1 SH3 domain-containing protein [Mangrovivirga halotolerans]
MAQEEGSEMPPKKVLQKADTLFVQGEYTEAFDLYEKLYLEEKKYSNSMILKMAYIKEALQEYPETLYLLGVAYDKTRNNVIREHMAKIADENDFKGYSVDSDSALASFYQRYKNYILVVNLAIIILLTVLVRVERKKNKSFPIASSIFFFVFLGFLVLQVNFLTPNKKGIIFEEKTFIMDGPSAGADLIKTVSPGHQVEIIDEQDVWAKIKWEGTEAYVKKKSLRYMI